MSKKLVVLMDSVGIKDVAQVGGKNASLGEMLQTLKPKGINIPSGFIVTAQAYQYFLKTTGLQKFIKDALKGLNTKDLKNLSQRGKLVRDKIIEKNFPADLKREIIKFYKQMEKQYGQNVDVAVRSSATAEDLPGASFAGEHETYLGIRGEGELLKAVRAAMASLFTDRAISYRVDKGFDHFKISLSVGIQKMVRSDLGASGVMFTLDTESGFKDVVLINAVWGLGEMIVQGKVTPDEFLVWKGPRQSASSQHQSASLPIISRKLQIKDQKMIYAKHPTGIKATKVIPCTPKEKHSFVISDKEVQRLAEWGVLIENHYTQKAKKWTPMDMEWAKDGKTGELFIVQARPETIHALRDFSKVKEYILDPSEVKSHKSKVIVTGASVGSQIATGKARIIMDVKGVGAFKKGEVLVTDMTDPDWEPIMKIASAIVTDKGGRTSHAAIVSRELGIACIVGSGNATSKIKTGQEITVDTTGSEGIVFNGALKFKVVEHDIKKLPKPKTHIMVNIATPDTAFEKSFLPAKGVGLAREEFVIASTIGIHPLALLNYTKMKGKIKSEIDRRTYGWKNKTQFYVDNLAYGIAKICVAFHPYPVLVRFSDFKTNEYRALIGGTLYEPLEENPMIGWRGASRYYDPKFKDAFKLECLAIKKVRQEFGLNNAIPMIPFCRTPQEGKTVVDLMAKFGLKRESKNSDHRSSNLDHSLKIYVMCEIPANVLLADDFLSIFDGMSIGSNDLTQLTLGLDRDAGTLTHIANENDPSVKKLIAEIIHKCKAKKKYIGICGQAPSDHPDFAKFLVEEGIESISLNPDTVVSTTIAIAETERKLHKK
ncbi:MAG: phosphoenolpyruvate synthase [Candidatus Liptonbacteria bacterium]|nr:phosphoenolpyruvate synthase [Candidatus Liptonbacteria bacterium]